MNGRETSLKKKLSVRVGIRYATIISDYHRCMLALIFKRVLIASNEHLINPLKKYEIKFKL